MIIMEVKNSHRLPCHCDGYRTSNYQLVFLSIFGPRASVRACWARLNQRGSQYIQVGGQSLWTEKKKNLISVRSSLDEDNIHMVLVHPDATNQISMFAKGFYFIGQDPEEGYWARFNRMCPVPLRPEWSRSIWEIGLEKQLITPLSGFGLPGYQIQAGPRWAEVVTEMIREGRLQ